MQGRDALMQVLLRANPEDTRSAVDTALAFNENGSG